MSKRSLAIAAMAMTLLGVLPSAASAQEPLPGIPMVTVDHPALALQPTMGGSRPTPASDPSPAAKKEAQPPAKSAKQPPVKAPKQPEAKQPKQPPMAPKPPAAPDTSGPKRVGKDLKSAVTAVAKLRWHDKLGDARVQAAATGKPILFIQALGDLEGFA